MASNAYMWIKGSRQGKVEGSCKVSPKLTGSLEILETYFKIVSPNNPLQGAMFGNHTRYPVEVLCKLDQATPHLLTAFTEGEPLSIEIDYFISASGGTHQAGASVKASKENYFKLVMTNAFVKSFDLLMYEERMAIDKKLGQLPELMRYGFTYSTMTMRSINPNREYTDKWEELNIVSA